MAESGSNRKSSESARPASFPGSCGILEPVSEYGGGVRLGEEDVEVGCTYLSMALVWGYLATVFSEEPAGACLHAHMHVVEQGEPEQQRSLLCLCVCLSILPLDCT